MSIFPFHFRPKITIGKIDFQAPSKRAAPQPVTMHDDRDFRFNQRATPSTSSSSSAAASSASSSSSGFGFKKRKVDSQHRKNIRRQTDANE